MNIETAGIVLNSNKKVCLKQILLFISFQVIYFFLSRKPSGGAGGPHQQDHAEHHKHPHSQPCGNNHKLITRFPKTVPIGAVLCTYTKWVRRDTGFSIQLSLKYTV